MCPNWSQVAASYPSGTATTSFASPLVCAMRARTRAARVSGAAVVGGALVGGSSVCDEELGTAALDVDGKS